FADRPLVQEVTHMRDDAGASFVHGEYRNEHGMRVIATGLLIPKTHWAIVVEQPRALLYAGIWRSVWFFAGLSCVGLLLSLSLAHVLSRRFTAPIIRLRQGVEQLGSGDLDHRVAIETHDEIGDLARQFNSMAGQLHASHADLERRVTENTRDLSALYALTTPIGRASQLQQVMDDAVVKVMDLTETEAASLHVLDADGQFTLASAYG